MAVWSTTSALIDAVRDRSDWTGGTDTQILDILNLAQERLMREHDFSFQQEIATRDLATASSGYSRFTQPTDAKQLVAMYIVEDSARTQLGYQDYFDFMATYTNPSNNGTACHWTYWRDEVYFGPTLQSAITAEVHYRKLLPALTATASNDFLTFAPDVLFYGTMREYWLHAGEEQRAAPWQGMLADSVRSLLTQHRGAKRSPKRQNKLRTPGLVVEEFVA